MKKIKNIKKSKAGGQREGAGRPKGSRKTPDRAGPQAGRNHIQSRLSRRIDLYAFI
jgi:hypothetical protein